MLPPSEGARVRQIKKSNLQHKMLPGYVRSEMVRCGKANCRCARGQLHGPYFYHFTWADGQRSKFYVKRGDVAATRAACSVYRELQREVRAGRENWRALMAHSRELIKFLSEAKERGWL